MGKYYTLHEKIRNLAFASRAGLLLLQMISNWIIPDHEADAFRSPPDPNLSYGLSDNIVQQLFGGLIRWDAQYFIHIAEYGYTHENTLAFFPLYPLLVRYLAQIVYFPLQVILNYHSTIIVTAVVLNVYLFVKASELFYSLSRAVLHHEVLAYRAAILFCINPASIFFSAPYSESLFALLTFSALLNYERGGGWTAPAAFGLAAATRSNGLVNIGFVLYHKLQHCSTYYYKLRNARSSTSDQVSLVLVVLLTFNYTLVPLFVASFSVVVPFLLYQAWCYIKYCGDEASSALPPHLQSFVHANFLHSPESGEAEWCYAPIPFAYTHVQDKHWEVGLFRYYQLKQLPNFLLAVPIVLMIICHAALYFVDSPQVVWSLGIPHPRQLAAASLKRKTEEHESSGDDGTCAAGGKEQGNGDDAALNGTSAGEQQWCYSGVRAWKVFVYTVHGLAVCFFCLLFVNVQVTTRLVCSSCPVVYWFAAHVATSSSSSNTNSPSATRQKTPGKKLLPQKLLVPEPAQNLSKPFAVAFLSNFPQDFWGQVVISYFLLYFMLGTVMFSNFLPWT
uniref:GPI mannosyltransferase 2 n=1 Tax=Hirondellea gigas TaxID=1518452 RepID=A0A2P2IC78_9CRUS